MKLSSFRQVNNHINEFSSIEYFGDRVMNKKMRSVLMAISLLSTVFAGNAFAQGTIDKVKSSGAITVAYRESSIPFSYLNDNGRPTGFGWEICGKIVDKVKQVAGLNVIEVKSQAVTSQNRIPLLQNGTVDVECGSTTNNSERAKQVTFATNYFYTGTRFLVKANSGIKDINSLKGKTVVVTTGTTNYQILRKLNTDSNIGFNLIGAKDHADAFLMVETGKADAFGMDDILLYGLRAASKNPAEFAVVGAPIQVEPYAIMIRKDDPSFKALVDGVLADLMKSGQFDAMYKKWFMSPIPPKDINLNAPMSKDLKDNEKALSDKPAA
jgi:glutamate/aspartate transport system substrate-binding protein